MRSPRSTCAPAAKATAHVCTNKWSGNFLNWATMQTIDPFRWALTGGYRVVRHDLTTTVLREGLRQRPGRHRQLPGPLDHQHHRTIAGATPLKNSNGTTWNGLKLRIQGMGVQHALSPTAGQQLGQPARLRSRAPRNHGTVSTSWVVSVRARVCDNDARSELFLSRNCKPYSNRKLQARRPDPAVRKPDPLQCLRLPERRQPDRATAACCAPVRSSSARRSRSRAAIRHSQRPRGMGPARPASCFRNPDADRCKRDTSAISACRSRNSGVMNYLNKFGPPSGHLQDL